MPGCYRGTPEEEAKDASDRAKCAAKHRANIARMQEGMCQHKERVDQPDGSQTCVHCTQVTRLAPGRPFDGDDRCFGGSGFSDD
jgi:hypothetical protein